MKLHMGPVSKSIIPKIGIENGGNGSPGLHYLQMSILNIFKDLTMPCSSWLLVHHLQEDRDVSLYGFFVCLWRFCVFVEVLFVFVETFCFLCSVV